MRRSANSGADSWLTGAFDTLFQVSPRWIKDWPKFASRQSSTIQAWFALMPRRKRRTMPTTSRLSAEISTQRLGKKISLVPLWSSRQLRQTAWGWSISSRRETWCSVAPGSSILTFTKPLGFGTLATAYALERPDWRGPDFVRCDQLVEYSDLIYMGVLRFYF